MAATIDIKVGVDDEAFLAHARKFDEYRAALDKTPDAWKNVAISSQVALAYTQGTAQALTIQADEIERIGTAVTVMRRESEKVERHWRGLQLSTAGVAKNIAGATEALLKWSGIGGVLLGVAGGLVGLGMGSMAGSVSSDRSAALGLGSTYGGRSSFLVNFNRLGDPGGILGRVNEIQHRADNIPLTALGLSKEEAQGDTADVAANAILRLKKLVDKSDPRFLSETLRANRADELISLNQAQILRGMSPEEVQKLVADYRRGKNELGMSADAQRKWQEFSTGLTSAEKKIENTFVKRIGALTPGLTKLSASFAVLVDKLMKDNGPVAHWLEKLNEGVEWLAKNVDTPEFQSKVEKFIAGVADLAAGAASLLNGILSFAKWLGVTPAEAHGYEGSAGRPYGGVTGMMGLRRAAAAGGGDSGGAGASSGGFIDALSQIESGNRNIYSTVDHDYPGQPGSRSQGYFQIDTPTWRQYAALVPGASQYPNAMAAPKEVQAQVAALIPLQRFGGRTKRMLQERYGALDFKQPVGKLAARFGAAPANTTTRVTINKPTGSDPNMAAAAAAHP